MHIFEISKNFLNQKNTQNEQNASKSYTIAQVIFNI